MTSLTIRTKISGTTFSSPELSNFIGEEVEILIKKIRRKKEKSLSERISEIHEIMRKHNPDNRQLSEELISERRKEAMNE